MPRKDLYNTLKDGVLSEFQENVDRISELDEEN